MSTGFSEALRNLRTEKGMSQQQLADLLYVDRSTISSWEAGRRTPDAAMISRIADVMNVNVGSLFRKSENDIRPVIIVVDDEPIILRGSLNMLSSELPQADVTAFSSPSAALEFAEQNKVDIAFIDIELGKTSGLDICRKLTSINSSTNVIFLTAFMDYSYRAWDTDASGFILKPLTREAILAQIAKLRHPVRGL